MPYRFKEAMLHAGKTVAEVARELQVSETTVRNWNNHFKKPTIDMLCRLAVLYGVTTDYLLGRSEAAKAFRLQTETVSPETLPVLHGCPVWDDAGNCGLVDAIKKQILFLDGRTLSFPDAMHLTTLPSPCTAGYSPIQKPLTRSELSEREQVWVIPVNVPKEIQRELQGYYTVHNGFVENILHQCFYLDNYGSKWLAFECEL